MKKSEIDAGVKGSHKGATLVNAFMRIKNRNLRMYCDASKSLYGEGIYELSPEYSHFQVPYEYWMARSECERLALVSRFFTEVGIYKSNTGKPANREEDRPMQVNVASNSNRQLEKVQRHLPITAEVLNIPIDVIPPSTLTILTGKNCVLLNSVQQWLLGCF